MASGPLDLAVLLLALGQQDRARDTGQVTPPAALPVATPWAAAWLLLLLLVLPPAREDDAVPLSGCHKVGKSMFWGHALGQTTPGCPYQLLLA